MRNPDPASLEPLPFGHDQHNLVVIDDPLLIATSSGVYYTEDLGSYSKAGTSNEYFHALNKCGDSVLGHVISSKPLRISHDRGRWGEVEELPSPATGTTRVICVDDEKAIYVTSAVYEVDLRDMEARRLVERIPMTRRVEILD